ncbi:hypothetical protein NB725_004563 [Pantoea ananatis]|nr:hypothetical protein [Pantoea ananatis]MCW0314732.1 hypothetical protein [Pantoea ananatis]MCW0341838.1 hypothetical protein [Pantoea ananatis]MCW0351066.1 hypothetical protein [Pantoea ananatis]MCW0360327.1 hypothetical protein [Pantoea ananatis]
MALISVVMINDGFNTVFVNRVPSVIDVSATVDAQIAVRCDNTRIVEQLTANMQSHIAPGQHSCPCTFRQEPVTRQ